MKKNVNTQNFVLSIEDAVESEICGKIINNLDNEKYDFERNAWITNNNLRRDLQVDGPSFLSFMENLDKIEYNKLFADCLIEAYNMYLESYTVALHAMGDITFRGFKFQTTPIGGGFHNWHYENASKMSLDRMLVWSLFLNDVEEGGELEFIYSAMRIKPKKGTLVLFPAYFTHTHRGNPPISNTKHIGTGWYLRS
tara:strand:+ start:3459 stop:4046 length:588 start_codon:yes stop_codon:yes gene_type:complete